MFESGLFTAPFRGDHFSCTCVCCLFCPVYTHLDYIASFQRQQCVRNRRYYLLRNRGGWVFLIALLIFRAHGDHAVVAFEPYLIPGVQCPRENCKYFTSKVAPSTKAKLSTFVSFSFQASYTMTYPACTISGLRAHPNPCHLPSTNPPRPAPARPVLHVGSIYSEIYTVNLCPMNNTMPDLRKFMLNLHIHTPVQSKQAAHPLRINHLTSASITKLFPIF